MRPVAPIGKTELTEKIMSTSPNRAPLARSTTVPPILCLLVALGPAACGIGPEDEPPAEETGGALLPVPDLAPSKATSQGPFSLKPPRVVERILAPKMLTLKFDRAVSASEVPPIEVNVDVVDSVNGRLQKRNVAAAATLIDGGRSLVALLTEEVRRGQTYFVRGKWRRCLFASFCTTYPANFGDFVVRSRTVPLPVAVDGRLARPAPAPVTATTAKALDPASPWVSKFDPPTPAEMTAVALPAPVGFRLRSASPADLSEQVRRELATVSMDFEGGQLDCSKLPAGSAAFRLWAVSPDLGAQHEMFADPSNPNPTDGGYKGSLRCDSNANRLIFNPPGRFFGDMGYMMRAQVTSTAGETILVESQFRTERPGLQVRAMRVENNYGGDNTCDDDFWSANYCDIYVTSAIATAPEAASAGRVPSVGDFAGIRYYPSDPVNGSRDLPWPGQAMFTSAAPLGPVAELKFAASDTDTTTGWKKFLDVAGNVAATLGAGLIKFYPEAGAISLGVGAGLKGIASLIPENGDDYLGGADVLFTVEDQRWYTTAPTWVPIPLQNEKLVGKRGPVVLYLQAEEYPKPWRLNVIF